MTCGLLLLVPLFGRVRLLAEGVDFDHFILQQIID